MWGSDCVVKLGKVGPTGMWEVCERGLSAIGAFMEEKIDSGIVWVQRGVYYPGSEKYR